MLEVPKLFKFMYTLACDIFNCYNLGIVVLLSAVLAVGLVVGYKYWLKKKKQQEQPSFSNSSNMGQNGGGTWP